MGERRTKGWPVCARWASILVLVAAGAVAPAPAADDRADRIAGQLQEERRRAGVAELERRDLLDRVALERAEAVAALPHKRRLSPKEPVDVGLKAAGVERYRRASVHLDMNRGYEEPAEAFLRTWRAYAAAWSTAMDPRYDAIGLATTRAQDGWIIFVAVFVEDAPGPHDLRDLERRAVAAVNRIREEHGLSALVARESLAGVARKHSEEMVRLGFFDHVTPDGRRIEDRVRAAGIPYRMVAENIQKNRGWDDPVQVAVDSWMKSRKHRDAILTPDFRETGVGAAVEQDGTVVFTQVFLLSPGAEPSAPEEPPAP